MAYVYVSNPIGFIVIGRPVRVLMNSGLIYVINSRAISNRRVISLWAECQEMEYPGIGQQSMPLALHRIEESHNQFKPQRKWIATMKFDYIKYQIEYEFNVCPCNLLSFLCMPQVSKTVLIYSSPIAYMLKWPFHDFQDWGVQQ